MMNLQRAGSLILALLSCTACAGGSAASRSAEAARRSAEAARANAIGTTRTTAGAIPREYASEVHGADAMVGTGHGKTYTMTWSEPTEVALHFVTGSSASGTGEFQAWLDVEESGGAPDHLREKSQPARHGTLWFKAKPGVAYAIALAGYDAHDQGPYALTVSPPPSSEVLPASIAKPEPQTEEERVTDEQASAIASTAREGYSLVGKPFRGSLENVSKQEIAVRRGQCYRAVITLGKEARHAQTKTTPMLTLAARADRVVTFSSSKYNGGGNARVLLSTDVCPSANGTVKIEWIDEAKSPVKNAGSGTFVLEILARPIAESALKARDLAAASGW